MKTKTYDFSGWATKANIKCSDGRTILKDAFIHNDGCTVPLVWNHQHNDPDNVLGKALLENREDGVYAYCSFNDTDKGRKSRELVQHGDIESLSIYANQLKQDGPYVLHGAIREVSLVLAGANPGACIESVIRHGEESEEEAVIYAGKNNLMLYHADPEIKPKKEESKEESKEDTEDDVKKKKEPKQDDEMTVEDVINSMTEQQQKVLYYLVAVASEKDDDDEKDNKNEGVKDMKHNVFDNDNTENTLVHMDMNTLIQNARQCGGSMRDAVNCMIEDGTLTHAVTDDDGNTINYGIANIDYLFPEARALTNEPDFIMRNQDWVNRVMTEVHRSPFSRIKSVHANITMEEARAKGYIKASTKAEEVFALLKRVTTPQTIYKKQKLDRDDIVDITDIDVVAWLKKEMRMMLNEEIARAVLIGDGRSTASNDKINPLNIRPIWQDAATYTISKEVSLASSASNDDKANAVIDGIIEAMEDYEGSGNPTLFCDKWFITRSLLMRNSIGERVYKSKRELADELGVADIVPVPVMKGQTRTDEVGAHTLVGVVVNLNDYNIGADKGGEINMFDDFDIDVNQYKYLMETRCSGALVKPYSAIAIEMTVTE